MKKRTGHDREAAALNSFMLRSLMQMMLKEQGLILGMARTNSFGGRAAGKGRCGLLSFATLCYGLA